MKLKKIMGIVLALVLVLSMVPTAFAAEEDTPVTQVWLQKTYNAEKGHAFTFHFTAVQDTTTAGYVKTPISCTIAGISFAETDTGTTKKRAELSFGAFTEVGTYRYFVTENDVADWTDTEHEKLIKSQAEYEVLVYVDQDADGNAKIANIVVNRTKRDDGTATTPVKVDAPDDDTNGFDFENTYVYEAGYGPDPTDPDPQYDTKGSLDVSKKVTKNGADLVEGDAEASKEFSFTASFTFPTGTDANSLGGIKANGGAITLTGGAYTFKLTHNQDMKFTGLPVGTTVTVTEAGAPNYKASASVSMNEAAASTVSNKEYNKDLTVSGQKLGEKTNTIDVTNENLYIPPMGVLLNVLPYVLMLAIAGGMMMLFAALKRKKAQYEEY